MDFENAIVVANFGSRAVAEAAVSLLASEGVDAIVSADDAGGELPNLDITQKIKVLVQSENEEFARGLLTQGDKA